jgi:hypothetical protein
MAKSRSGGRKASEYVPGTNISVENNNALIWLQAIAQSLDSVAQSLRDQTQLQRQAQAKGRQPRIVSIGQATYQRDDNPTDQSLLGEEAGAEVPGFRRR